MNELLLINGQIVTVNPNRDIIEKGFIYIVNNKIVDIGDMNSLEGEKYKEVSTRDLNGKVVFPGFINTHNHLFQVLLKGLGDDMRLDKWLSTMTFPASTILTEEDVYYAAMGGVVEGIKSGMTTNLDYMYAHNRANLSDGIIKAFIDVGQRGILARCVQNTGEEYGVQKATMQDLHTVEEDIRRLFENYHNSNNGKIKIWTGPAAMWECTLEMHKLLYDLANEYNSWYTSHISETPFDRQATTELYGCNDFELLEKLNITGSNVLMVHTVYLTEEEIARAAKYKMKISHNVLSNMYLSSGVAPIPEMLKSGLTVGLGVDGAASNNAQDMIELMKTTALLHKVDKLDPIAMTAEKVLEMATIDGARAIGMEKEIGSIEKGKLADLVIFNPYLNPKAIPLHNPVSTLVYSSSCQNIETVIIDGRIILDNGKITSINDEKKLYEDINNIAEDLCLRANITNRGSGHKWNHYLDNN
ncbi:MAG: amidohydrolase [Miniphocaeibacter sp.]|uniref:amidohydrolase family protein n=1 Tax=Miniphocaeibacter sp. TaxID=3100973 RepID=UPI0018077035|nr:amidohydrolase [Gallicola sp.]